MSDGGDYSDFAVPAASVQSAPVVAAPDYSDFAVAPAASQSASPLPWSGPSTITQADAAAAAKAAGVDPDLYSRLVFNGESGGNTRAVSPKGALGPSQLMPGTAHDLGVNPLDTQDNLKGGALYLKQLLTHYGGDSTKAVAAYNAGPGAVDQAGGVPNFPETQAYVARVLNTPLPREDGEPAGGMSDADAEKAYDAAHPTAATAPAVPTTHIEWNAKTNRYEDATGTPYERTGATTVEGPNGSQFVITPNAAAPAGQIPIKTATPGLDSGTTDTARAAFVPGLAQGAENVGSTFKNLDQFVEQNVPGAQGFNRFLNGPGYPTVDQQVQTLHADRLLNDARYAGNGAYEAGKVGGTIAASTPFLMAGGAALPEMGVGGNLFARGAGLAGRGAIEGSAAGALASGGNDQSLMQNVGAGALTGAVAAPFLGGLATAGRAIGRNLFQPADAATTSTIVNSTEPELGAGALPDGSPAMRAAMTLRRALARDNIDPADAVAAARADPSAPAFHAGGANVAGLAEVAAKSPGPAQTIIRDAVSAHQDAVPGQIKADIGTALGGNGDYLSTLDSAISTRRLAANQGISAIEGDPVALNQNSVLALRSPVANAAVKTAANNALSSADPITREAGANLNRIADQVLDNPSTATMTIRNAQDISKSLLDAADGAYRSGDGAKGLALKTLGRAIRDNAADPAQGGSQAYGDWLKQYGSDSDNIDALNLGHGVFASAKGNSAAQVQKTLDGMGSDSAADYYKKGVSEALIDQTRSSQGGVGTMRQLLKNEDLRDKVRIAFPDDASYDQFVASAENRVRQQGLNNKVTGGSPTYPLQAARADVEGQPFHPFDAAGHAAEFGTNLFTGNFGALAGQGLKALQKNIPRADRSVIGNTESNALLGHALSNPDAFETLLTLPDRATWERANPKVVAPGNAFMQSVPVQSAIRGARNAFVPSLVAGSNALQSGGSH